MSVRTVVPVNDTVDQVVEARICILDFDTAYAYIKNLYEDPNMQDLVAMVLNVFEHYERNEFPSLGVVDVHECNLENYTASYYGHETNFCNALFLELLLSLSRSRTNVSPRQIELDNESIRAAITTNKTTITMRNGVRV